MHILILLNGHVRTANDIDTVSRITEFMQDCANRCPKLNFKLIAVTWKLSKHYFPTPSDPVWIEPTMLDGLSSADLYLIDEISDTTYTYAHFGQVGYNIHKSNQIIRNIEQTTGQRFDKIIRIRPDLSWHIDPDQFVDRLPLMSVHNAVYIPGGDGYGSNDFMFPEFSDGFEIYNRLAFDIASLAYVDMFTNTSKDTILNPSIHVWFRWFLWRHGVIIEGLPLELQSVIARPLHLFSKYGIHYSSDMNYQEKHAAFVQLNNCWMKDILAVTSTNQPTNEFK